MKRSAITLVLWFPVVFVCLLLAVPAWAAAPADRPMREAGRFETVWKNPKPIRLISRESIKIEVPPVPARAGVDTVLSLRTRLRSERLNGWNNYLAVRINGRPVNAVDDLVRTRLINRPNEYNDKIYFRGHCILGNRLNTFFSPSFDRWEFHLKEPVQTREKYWFILRVEDLLHADRPNVIELTDTAKFRDFGAKKAEEIVVIVDPLEVGYFAKPAPRISRKCGLSAKTFEPVMRLAHGASTVEVNKLGGLRISHGRGVFVLESAFSYPNAGFNVFSGTLDKSQSAWRPNIRKDGRKIIISAAGEQHRVRRVIELLDDRLDFHDTVANLTDQILPVMALNTIGLDAPQESIWIGGMPNAGSFSIATSVDSQNSTVFISAKDVHVGIYAKDTVLRNQFRLESSPRTVTFGTKQLGIAPKKSCTLRWRVYLSGDPDYFSFINRIRNDDDLNYTLIGPFDFLRYSQGWTGAKRKDIQRTFANECWRVGNVMPWFDYYNGPLNPHSYDRPKFKALAQAAVKNVTDAVPGFFILGGREITFFTVPKEADWSKLPEADSFGKKADGSYSFINEHCPDPKSRYIFAYPALDNAYHKRLMNDVDFLMDECGYRGLYFDIFTVPSAVSYDRWDGHSVDIDPETYTLVRTKNNVPILMGPAQAEMIKKIMSKGGVVVCNQSSASEEMQSLPVMSFVEGTYNVPGTYLYSPIGLCNMWTNFSDEEQKKGATLVDQLTQRLKLGALMYHYCPHLGLGPSEYEAYQILAHSFPITPVGLHAGWIEGKERIITCKPGRYTWKRADKPRVLVWNAEGRRVRQSVAIVKGEKTWTIDLAELPQGGVGIVEEDPYELAQRRRPLPVAPPTDRLGDVVAGPITECKLRNVISDPGCEHLIGKPANDSWSYASADKFVVDKEVLHTGKQSMRLDAKNKDTKYGTYSGVGASSEPIRYVEFGGWAKVKPTRGEGARPWFYAQIRLKDGKLIESTASFKQSPLQWQFVGNRVPVGDKEIKRIILYCFVQGHVGPVWLDDMYIGLKPQPFTKGPNLIPEPGFEDTSKWRPHAEGFSTDDSVEHSGKRSLRLKAEKAFRIYGAHTIVKPDGPADGLLIGGWCRSTKTGGRASITADVHYKDGRALPCLSVIFPEGEHNWVNLEKEILISRREIDYITITAELLFAPAGQVWLDDVYLHLLRR